MAGSGRLPEQGTKKGGQTGPNPTDRAKSGVKRSVLTEGGGGPLGVVVAGANINDHLLLEDTIEAIVVDRPEPTDKEPQNLSLDRGYDNQTAEDVVEKEGYTGHIRHSDEDAPPPKGKKRYPARRWVVERTLSWLSKCRAILIRWNRKARNYLGLIQIACALIWYRRYWKLSHATAHNTS